jgi:hypothetical protein
MSYNSTPSTACSQTDSSKLSIAELRARAITRRALSKQKRADHAQRLADIERSRQQKNPGVTFLTPDEVVALAIKSGALAASWTTPESMERLRKINEEGMALLPSYFGSEILVSHESDDSCTPSHSQQQPLQPAPDREDGDAPYTCVGAAGGACDPRVLGWLLSASPRGNVAFHTQPRPQENADAERA